MLRKLIVGAIVVNFLFMLASVFAPSGMRVRDAALADNTTTLGRAASATVPQRFELNANLYELDANGEIIFTPVAGDLAFGDLEALTVNGTVQYMRGQKAYAVVMVPATSGTKYQIQFTGQPLTNAAGDTIGTGPDNGVLPNGRRSTRDAYLVIPDYQWDDRFNGNVPTTEQGPPPPDAIIGQAAPAALQTNYVVYQSGVAGFGRIVRAYLGIGGPPVSGVFQYCDDGHDGGTCVNPVSAKDYTGGVAWDLVTPDQPAGNYGGSVTFTLVPY